MPRLATQFVRRDPGVAVVAAYGTEATVGGAARFKKVQLSGPDDPRAAELMVGHGGLAWEQPQYVVEGKTSSNHAAFSSANSALPQ